MPRFVKAPAKVSKKVLCTEAQGVAQGAQESRVRAEGAGRHGHGVFRVSPGS